MDERSRARTAVATASRRLADDGLVLGTAGNVSLRFDGPTGPEIAVTATGAVLADASEEHVAVVALDGGHLEGALAATSEVELHLGILRERGGAVVHTHSTAATALSLVVDELPVVHYQQLLLGGAVRVAPFHVFGSADLAEAVHAAMEGRQAAILAHHGTVASGHTLDAAVENALLLERAAELYARARAIGTPRSLSAEQQAAVVEAALATGYGSTRPA
ncbi:class II aldolase/adducin family protein [Patulibacter sp. S7RM1-6]